MITFLNIVLSNFDKLRVGILLYKSIQSTISSACVHIYHVIYGRTSLNTHSWGSPFLFYNLFNYRTKEARIKNFSIISINIRFLVTTIWLPQIPCIPPTLMKMKKIQAHVSKKIQPLATTSLGQAVCTSFFWIAVSDISKFLHKVGVGSKQNSYIGQSWFSEWPDYSCQPSNQLIITLIRLLFGWEPKGLSWSLISSLRSQNSRCRSHVRQCATFLTDQKACIIMKNNFENEKFAILEGFSNNYGKIYKKT